MGPSIPRRQRGTRLLIGGALAWACAIVMCVVAAMAYASASRLVEHTLEVQHALDGWSLALTQAESGMRGYIATGQNTYLQRYTAAIARHHARAARLRALTGDNADQRGGVDAAGQRADAVVRYLHGQLALLDSGQRDEALVRLRVGATQALLDDFNNSTTGVYEEETRLLEERRAEAKVRSWTLMFGATLVTIVSGALLAYAWRREARHEAAVTQLGREARERLRRLSELASALASARTTEHVADVVVLHGQQTTGGDTCCLYDLDEAQSVLRLMEHRGISPDLIDKLKEISESTGNPAAFRAMKEGRSIWVERATDYRALYPELANAEAQGPRAQAFGSVPLVAEGRPVGLLAIGFYEPHKFMPEERAFIETLANQCAQALRRATRLTAEDAERARAEFLAKAGEALASSMDYQSTLATVAQLVVPQLGDWCAIDLVQAGTAVTQQVAVAHVDPKKIHFAREMGERYSPDTEARTGVPQVIRSGKSELYREIPDALLEAAAKDAEHLRLIRELRLGSAMIVPLRSHGLTLGAMSFVYAESGRRYSEADLAFAEDFARRAALAIANARAANESEEARAKESELRAEAERANRAKDDFLATVSHELRTPLNAILGWTVSLRSRPREPDVDRALAVIERNARAQATLIEDVLDVSRIITGKLALNLAPTNVPAAARAAIETVAPTAQVKDVRITTEVADESLTITADADRVQQIIWNLLSNAVKFTPSGGTVSVRVDREGSEVIVSVSDSGEGIRPELLQTIFEPFQQADASTTRRHGGLGLGLAIVKHLVTAHGGTIQVESAGAGAGATFSVVLPARSVVPAVASPPSARPPSVPAPPSIELAVDLRGLRVLVVDDEADARLLVEALLRDLGAEVDVAGSVAEALEILATGRQDVLVSDIGMPGEDGYSLISRLRARPAAQGGKIPAIALTAFARSQDAQRAIAAGFQVHLTKPVEPAQLARTIASLRSTEDRTGT